MPIPRVSNHIVCVVDRENVALAAVLSSYLTRTGVYTPVLTFPRIDQAAAPESIYGDEAFIPTIVGTEAAARVNNAVAKLGGCQHVVLAGLSEPQRSYLRPFGRARVLTIADPADVADVLATIGITRPGTLSCKPDQAVLGLHLAQRTGYALILDDDAGLLAAPARTRDGIVVVERDPANVGTVIAVNYAHAIDADLAIVAPIERDEAHQIIDDLERWREERDVQALAAIDAPINARLAALPIREYAFATFFTDGLPYALGLRNAIPCSHVHLSLRPDLLVLNAILAEYEEPFGSAVLFCHDDFLAIGESLPLQRFLASQGIVIRTLIGRDATVYSLDYHAQHFPYDVLHIVSHGGQRNGNTVQRPFVDRDGLQHVVEYDEVAGFERIPGRRKIGVHFLRIFRTLDGFAWRSPELKAQGIARYVSDDAVKAMDDLEAPGVVRTPKENISLSRSIVCNDSFHQAMFRSLAAYTSPTIFNNACSSWSYVAEFFLSGGARAYLGTLWPIDNDSAVSGAEAFYVAAMGSTLLEGLTAAIRALDGTDDENIYLLWGLDFSTLRPGPGQLNATENVLHALVDELFLLIDSVSSATASDVRRNAFDAIRSIRRDLRERFQIHNWGELDREINDRLRAALATLRTRVRANRDGPI